MNRLPTRVPLFTVILALLPVLVGCELLDKLKARDHLNKGVAAYGAQKYPQAVEHFEEAIRLDSELTAAHLYLATTYRAQWVPQGLSEANVQKANQAIQTFETVLAQNPDQETRINAMANIAGIYGGMDQPDKAKEWYRKRIEAQPDNPEPYYGIGTIDWKLSHDETGLNGDNAPNLSDEERVRVAQLVDSGVEALKKALEIDPDYSQAMEYLNLLYRERAYLAKDDEEKKMWEKEALRLALQALEVKRRKDAEAEKLRHSFGKGKGTSQGN